MNIENRFLVEFSVENDDIVSRYVVGQSLTIETVRKWAEDLVESEDCLKLLGKIESLN